MKLETKFNEGDTVWVLNPKSGCAIQRTVCGLRTQSLNGEQRTIYCFVKDWCLDKEYPTTDDCFWLSEERVFHSKKELIASF